MVKLFLLVIFIIRNEGRYYLKDVKYNRITNDSFDKPTLSI